MRLSLLDLADHFVVAMPSLDHNFFERAVVYVCEHTEKGSMGLVINRPVHLLRLSDVFEQMNISYAQCGFTDSPVLSGGPIHPQNGFILHPLSDRSASIQQPLALTTSKDVLEAIAANQGPRQFIIAMGYVSWGPGQLEAEIKQNQWLVTPKNEFIVFHCPMSKRWEASAALIGVKTQYLMPGGQA